MRDLSGIHDAHRHRDAKPFAAQIARELARVVEDLGDNLPDDNAGALKHQLDRLSTLLPEDSPRRESARALLSTVTQAHLARINPERAVIVDPV